jgi:hypothetical protein
MKSTGANGSRRIVRVGGGRSAASNGASRACADVNGRELFFDSPDLALSALPELFATALLPAVTQRRWKLRMTEPLDPEWLTGAQEILEVWAGWWQTPAALDDVLEAPRGSPSEDPAGERVGLCFSGGLDAFHTLLCSGRAIDDLVFAHGYDIPIDEQRRFAAAEGSVRAVAAAVGARAVIVRTNLRRRRPFKGAGWGRTHGGALAALGHACTRELGELLISSAYTRESGNDWGSSWDTDPGWSSSRLQVTHFGDEFTRDDKMRALVHNPLVRDHIRVCWENRAPAGNCGECEKCVRTMVYVELLGEDVSQWPFAGTGTLVERLDRVPFVHPQQVSSYEPMLEICEDAALAAAMRRLVARAYDPFEDRAQRVRRREDERGRRVRERQARRYE